MSDAQVLHEYEGRLKLLQHWPNKKVIQEITSFADRNGRLADDLADILTSTIANPHTNVAFKIPLFYLVDSIMCNLGGVYRSIFSSHIAVVFQKTFSEVGIDQIYINNDFMVMYQYQVNEMDKARLDFLLSTWEARHLLPPPVLANMRRIVGRRIVTAPVAQKHYPMESPTRPSYPHQPPRHDSHHIDRGRDMDRSRDDYSISNQFGQKNLPHARSNDITLKPQTTFNTNSFSDELGRDKFSGSVQSTKQQQSVPPSISKVDSNKIHGLVGEEAVNVDLEHTKELLDRLSSNRSTSLTSSNIDKSSQMTYARLNELLSLASSQKFPPMPVFLKEPLPSNLVAAREAEVQQSFPKKMLKMPPFRADELSNPPSEALKALYQDRPFFCRQVLYTSLCIRNDGFQLLAAQDGNRFKTQAALAAHLDELFRIKEDKKRKEGQVLHREWYCLRSQWITDFGAHTTGSKKEGGEGGDQSITLLSSGAQLNADNRGVTEEMVVPADEHFTRCPVSYEAFIPEWDDEEGDYMYRNAVKVLVSAESDSALFGQCQPTSHPLLKYAIVHQLLVMDGWLASGKAITVQDAIQKVKNEADQKTSERVVDILLSAIGEEDDEEDVFLILDATGNIATDLMGGELGEGFDMDRKDKNEYNPDEVDEGSIDV